MNVEKRTIRRLPCARWIAALVATVLGLLPAMPAGAQAAPSPRTAMPLFQHSSVSGSFTDQHAVVRSRSVGIDAVALAKTKAGEHLTLNFFEDVTLLALIERSRQSGISTVHLQGSIVGVQDSDVLVVVHDGAVAGLIRAPGKGTFRIRSAPGRGQIVEEVDGSKFFPCGTGPEHAISAEPAVQPQFNDAAGPVQCPLFIDIMIVYTPEARDLEGGSAAIQAIALLAIDATNAAYANSQINHFVRLVYVGEVDYVESGDFGLELDRLRNPTDGFMDEVHALRDQYGADLVDLFISHTQGNTICGVAYLMDVVSPGFEQYGFSVCNTGCVSGGFVFEHEIGHNMGCHHDRDNAGSPPAFDFSYGHRFTGDNFVLYRTIMSYSPGDRIPYFSNPNVAYQGQPTGVPAGSTDPQGNPNSADNAQTHNLTSETVAAFRPAVGGSGQAPHTWPTPDYIQPADLLAGDHFGVSVALDGDLMIIGAYSADVLAFDSGAAYIYRFNPETTTWTEVAKLWAFDGFINDRFGISVDIHDDRNGGGIAVVGAYQTNDGGRDSGAAYVFRSTGGEWTSEAKLIPSDTAPGDLFGRSVSLAVTPSGQYVLVGSYLDDDGGSNSGSAYVFKHLEMGVWEQAAKIVAPDALPQDQFGFDVDLEFDPQSQQLYALIGAWRDDEGEFDSGSAYVFRTHDGKLGQEWVFVTKLVPPNPAISDQAGYAVDLELTDSSRVALVSLWQYDGAVTNSGAVYVFRDNGKSWLPEARLTAFDAGLNDRFGSAVAICGDLALVGAYLDDDLGLMNNGAAYVFRRSGFNWLQEAKVLASDAADEDQFGFSVALQGSRAAIGAWMKDLDKTQLQLGAVYVSEGVPTVDCNNNGVHDDCDIFSGTSQDANANGIPDECEVPTCPADLNGDGVVNVSDLLAVINGWGTCPAPPTPCPADIAPTGAPDGVVNVSDLLAIINNWGSCP